VTRDFDAVRSGHGALLAEFASPAAAARALRHLRARGYLWLETYAPFALEDEDAHAGSGWPPLGIAGLAAGGLGALAGYGVQWYASARSYALDIGGRPAHATTAFVPIVVETALLFAAAAILVAWLVALRLPRLWQPLFEIDGFERASVDRFWVALDLADPAAEAETATRELIALGPLRVLHVESGP